MLRLLLIPLLCALVSCGGWPERVVHTVYITNSPGASTDAIDYIQPSQALSYLTANNDSIAVLAPEFISSFAMSFFRIVIDIDVATSDQVSLVKAIYANADNAWFASPALLLNKDATLLSDVSLDYPQVLAATPFGAMADVLDHWLRDDAVTNYYINNKARCSICGAVQPRWGPFFGPGSRYPRAVGHECFSLLQHDGHDCELTTDSAGYGCIANCTSGPDPAPYCDDLSDDYLTIRGVPVEASEARFGGFAIERTDWPPTKPLPKARPALRS